MITWGISANSHDAALAVFKESCKGLTDRKELKLKFASHSERYSRIKNDPNLNQRLVNHALEMYGPPKRVVWYEKPLKKTVRQLFAGQGWKWRENNIKQYLRERNINAPISYVDHHTSHASGGYFTSGFDNAAILCIDSIGEFETLTIWKAKGNSIKRVFTQSYPHSIGLWYSAMTQRLGLKPNEDEYILMGMRAYGLDKNMLTDIASDFIKKFPTKQDHRILFKKNLHRGCLDWRPDLTSEQDYFDIAQGTQELYELIFDVYLEIAKSLVTSKNLVLAGGCALNCSANSRAFRHFENVWIMPSPGDAGSSVGAVLAYKQRHIKWPGANLGYKIQGDYPVEQIIQELLATGICGVANGSAEFGPRAFGNRSLLADPRGSDIKDRVNQIKQRQQFRPFAPAILEEHAADNFHGPTGPYMQYTSFCKHPELYPAICHADGTSRVQTVSKNDPNTSGFRRLLERWYQETGCPILLNTSLNIKGQPIVNDEQDAKDFESYYGVKVFL